MALELYDLDELVKNIQQANSIILSTHKQCDGDGLGAALGLFHALKKIGKNVRVILVDTPADKYNFLIEPNTIDIYERPHLPIEETDLTLIFDTNDRRLVDPLYSELENKCKKILFVDHHPVLKEGPKPPEGSFIDTRAASTGEISYFLIKTLGVNLDEQMARPLYASIAFDTQIFKFVKSAANSMLIAADLLNYEKKPELIHQSLFATYKKNKLQFLGEVLGTIEYFSEDRFSILVIPKAIADKYELSNDDTRDVIDMLMNVQSVEVAAFIRESDDKTHKLSLRSKGNYEILDIAEAVGGGGHLFAAGATIEGKTADIKSKIIHLLQNQFQKGCLPTQ
jgi:phosphoesterase RecJ-like protein